MKQSSRYRLQPSKRYGYWNGSDARKRRGLRPVRNWEVVLPRSAGPTSRRRRDADAWFALENLDALIRAHRSDGTAGKVVRILRADLIVADDIGLLPVSTDAAEGLYRLVDAAYEKRPFAIS